MVLHDPNVAGKIVGLLGGSFNPAHDGHVSLSMQAIELLGLDEVWWLVSPQNPLKPTQGMLPLANRMVEAKEKVAGEPTIKVTDIESQLGLAYTADTLEALMQHFADTQFVWLMGADNLATIHRWKRWHDIFAAMPIAVCDRDEWGDHLADLPAVQEYGQFQLLEPSELVASQAPCWSYLAIERHPASSTKIRQEGG